MFSRTSRQQQAEPTHPITRSSCLPAVGLIKVSAAGHTRRKRARSTRRVAMLLDVESTNLYRAFPSAQAMEPAYVLLVCTRYTAVYRYLVPYLVPGTRYQVILYVLTSLAIGILVARNDLLLAEPRKPPSYEYRYLQYLVRVTSNTQHFYAPSVVTLSLIHISEPTRPY